MATGKTEGKNGLFPLFGRVWEGFFSWQEFDMASAFVAMRRAEATGREGGILGQLG